MVEYYKAMPYSILPTPRRSHSLINKRRWRRKKIKIFGALVTAGFIFFIFGLVALIFAFGFYARELPSPNKLKERNVEQATKILDRHGALLYDVYGDQNRTLVKLDQVPEELKKATIAIEDKNFYKHKGFDLWGYARVIREIIFERKFTGGSTLTQQLVKNSLLSPERTITRKIKEFILAVQIERKFSKDEILQIYLNEVPYGGTAWGVEAASNLYFGKHVSKLSLVEAAILAGLPQKPTTYSPFGSNPKSYIDRTKDVLRRMKEDGYITGEEEEKAIEELAKVKFSAPSQNIKAPHFSLYVRERLVEKYGEKLVLEGGLRVTTSLDLKIQEMAQKIVTDEINKPENKRLRVGNGAAIIQDPKTGEILAMVGSKNYFDKSYDGQVNVSTSLRQPGSAIKPINYVTGFKNGYTPATMFLDMRTDFGTGYKPVNYDGRDHGPQQIRFALGNSYNIPAVKMLAVNGVQAMIDTAKDMGINTFTNPDRYGLSLTLGGGEVKLIELTNAFSVFANGGKRVDPATILKVSDSNGKVLEEFKPKDGQQVLTPQHAFLITSILSDKNAKLAAFGSYGVSILSVPGHDVAVKTGTTDDKRDNWTFGFSSSYTLGIWTGNNDNASMHPSLSSGITGAAPIWHRIMSELLKGKPNEPFKRPDKIVSLQVDAVSGMKPGPNTTKTRSELFASWQVPQREDDTRVKVRICKPTGLLASESCEAAGLAIDKVFFVLKDPYTERFNPSFKYCKPCPPTKVDNNYYNPSGEEKPVVTITTPSNGATVGSNFTVTAKITTPYTVTKVEFYFDGSLYSTITNSPYSAEFSLAGAGNHQITVKAFDSAGSSGESSINVNVN